MYGFVIKLKWILSRYSIHFTEVESLKDNNIPQYNYTRTTFVSPLTPRSMYISISFSNVNANVKGIEKGKNYHKLESTRNIMFIHKKKKERRKIRENIIVVNKMYTTIQLVLIITVKLLSFIYIHIYSKATYNQINIATNAQHKWHTIYELWQSQQNNYE